jgi:hypothetical protein
MDLFCSWLYTPRNDGKPRMLRLYEYIDGDDSNESDSFIERIKKAYFILNIEEMFE